MKCTWCGWTGDEDELDLNEHDIPMFCPECGHIADEDGEVNAICQQFMAENPDYEAWFDSIEAHAGYYPVVIMDKHILQIPCRYVFESISEFDDWAKGVVLE